MSGLFILGGLARTRIKRQVPNKRGGYKICFYRKSTISMFWVEAQSNPKGEMMSNYAGHVIYRLEYPKTHLLCILIMK